jgi:cysteine desulfurase
VLTAMGLDEKRVSEAVRISWNHDTKVDFTALVNYVRSMVD